MVQPQRLCFQASDAQDEMHLFSVKPSADASMCALLLHKILFSVVHLLLGFAWVLRDWKLISVLKQINIFSLY